MAHSTKVAKTFGTALETEKDWEKRVSLMSNFETLIRSDSSVEFSVKDVLLFRPALVLQVGDNKTAVTKQACELCAALVRFHLHFS